MGLYSGVDRLLIVNAVTDEAVDFPINLGQQHRHLRRILLVAIGHRGRNYPALVIDADVQFFPALALFLAMLLGMPFALTTNLQAATVNDQRYRSRWRTIDLLSNRYCSVASRECRMIRTGKDHVH